MENLNLRIVSFRELANSGYMFFLICPESRFKVRRSLRVTASDTMLKQKLRILFLNCVLCGKLRKVIKRLVMNLDSLSFSDS